MWMRKINPAKSRASLERGPFFIDYYFLIIIIKLGQEAASTKDLVLGLTLLTFFIYLRIYFHI